MPQPTATAAPEPHAWNQVNSASLHAGVDVSELWLRQEELQALLRQVNS
jgi:hypothetical protein